MQCNAMQWSVKFSKLFCWMISAANLSVAHTDFFAASKRLVKRTSLQFIWFQLNGSLQRSWHPHQNQYSWKLKIRCHFCRLQQVSTDQDCFIRPIRTVKATQLKTKPYVLYTLLSRNLNLVLTNRCFKLWHFRQLLVKDVHLRTRFQCEQLVWTFPCYLFFKWPSLACLGWSIQGLDPWTLPCWGPKLIPISSLPGSIPSHRCSPLPMLCHTSYLSQPSQPLVV